MNSDVNEIENTDTTDLPDELTVLKLRAKTLGITYSNNISVEKLRERIQTHLSTETKPDVAPDDGFNPKGFEVNPLVEPVSPAKRKKVPTLRQHLHNTQMKLVRVRITNLDPKKKDLPGEIFTVANEHLGTVRKYVPYGAATEHGYHLPYCIYRQLEERQFLNIRTFRGRNGQINTETKWVKEFAFEVLPPLSEAELAKLAASQAAEGLVEE